MSTSEAAVMAEILAVVRQAAQQLDALSQRIEALETSIPDRLVTVDSAAAMTGEKRSAIRAACLTGPLAAVVRRKNGKARGAFQIPSRALAAWTQGRPV